MSAFKEAAASLASAHTFCRPDHNDRCAVTTLLTASGRQAC